MMYRLMCEDCGTEFMHHSFTESHYRCDECKYKSNPLNSMSKAIMHNHRCDSCNNIYWSEVKSPVYKLCDHCLESQAEVYGLRSDIRSFEQMVADQQKKYDSVLSEERLAQSKTGLYELAYRRLSKLVAGNSREKMMRMQTLVVVSKLCGEQGIEFKDALLQFAREELYTRAVDHVLADMIEEQNALILFAEDAADDSSEYFGMTKEGHDYKEKITSYFEASDGPEDDDEELATRFAQIG